MRFLAYKGAHSYEVQIGKFVFQARHRGAASPVWFGNIKRFNVFIDRV